MNQDKGNNAQDANQPYSPAASKGESHLKVSNAVTSSSSSFKKGINCFNCGYEGHYAHECRKPKQQDDRHGGTAPRARLNMLEVHEDGPDDHKKLEGDHPEMPKDGWKIHQNTQLTSLGLWT